MILQSVKAAESTESRIGEKGQKKKKIRKKSNKTLLKEAAEEHLCPRHS